MFIWIVSTFGAQIDGNLMGCFRVPRSNLIVYFLFNPNTGKIARCNADGGIGRNDAWLNISPHQFVLKYWHRETVSSFGQIYVMGRPLTAFERK